jgi:hypothetical protein
MQRRFSEPKGWLVIELRRVKRREHGEMLEKFPLSKKFPTKEDAERQLPSFSPTHGGELHVVPSSYFQESRPKSKSRGLRRDYRH